jgi:hypothetical protein
MPAAGPATATSRYQPLLLPSATVTAVTPTLLVTASTRHRKLIGGVRCGADAKMVWLTRIDYYYYRKLIDGSKFWDRRPHFSEILKGSSTG